MVSVIIPVYNVEAYLPACVDSVLAQSYADLEVILVDDGSPDGCGSICDGYAARDERVRVIHKPNGGLSDARNAGLKAAAGAYVYFLDSDDYIRQDAVGLLVERAQSEQAELVYFDAESFLDPPDGKGHTDRLSRTRVYPTASGAETLDRLCSSKEYFSCVPLLFFTRAFLERSGLTFCKGILHEDELFAPLAFVRAERAAQLCERLYYRRHRAGSIITQAHSLKSFSGSCTVIRQLQAELAAYPEGSIGRRALMQAMRTKADNIVLTYLQLERSLQGEAREQFDECLRIFRENRYFDSRRLRLSCEHPLLCAFYVNRIRRKR